VTLYKRHQSHIRFTNQWSKNLQKDPNIEEEVSNPKNLPLKCLKLGARKSQYLAQNQCNSSQKYWKTLKINLTMQSQEKASEVISPSSFMRGFERLNNESWQSKKISDNLYKRCRNSKIIKRWNLIGRNMGSNQSNKSPQIYDTVAMPLTQHKQQRLRRCYHF